MNSKIMKALGATIAAVLMITALTAGFARGQKSNAPELSSGKRSIEGAWKNQVRIVDCDTRTVFATFPGLLTYHHGGTVSETAGDTPFRSSGGGTWVFNGSQSYGAKFMFYTFSPGGVPAGYFKVVQNIHLSDDGNVLTDNATFEIYDAAGNLMQTGCAEATATRFD
jgi:hypothetical protein